MSEATAVVDVHGHLLVPEAGRLARERTVDGLVLLAPAAGGRAYLREVAAWTAMTKREFLVSATDGPEGGLMSAGFVLSAATVNEIRRLKLLDAAPCGARRVLFAGRPGHAGDSKLAAELSVTGMTVETIAGAGHTVFRDDHARFMRVIEEWLARAQTERSTATTLPSTSA